MSRLRRLALSDKFFFISCRIHRLRRNLNETEFSILAEVIRERLAAQIADTKKPVSAPPARL